jgi:hypothetical protein
LPWPSKDQKKLLGPPFLIFFQSFHSEKHGDNPAKWLLRKLVRLPMLHIAHDFSFHVRKLGEFNPTD